MSREDVLAAPAWTLSIDAYRGARDASCPAMFEEASPFQVARMSGAERRRYEAARDGRYEKATSAYHAWQAEVRDAFERGEVTATTPGLSRDARDLLHGDAEDRDHALLDEVHERALVLCRVHPEEVVVGGVYYDAMSRGPVRVLKVNRKSVVIPTAHHPGGQMKRPIALLSHFPPHALSSRGTSGRRTSARERAQQTNAAIQAWHERVAELRGAA